MLGCWDWDVGPDDDDDCGSLVGLESLGFFLGGDFGWIVSQY